jgi:hypothetical protein
MDFGSSCNGFSDLPARIKEGRVNRNVFKEVGTSIVAARRII